MATTKTLIVSLMICLVLLVFAVPIVFQITYLNVLLVNYPIHLSEVMVLNTFDKQSLKDLMNWMECKQTNCVCDELLCDYCHSCSLLVSDNLVHCFMADEFSNMAK